jgi:Flp pilus assembly protein TadB
MWRDVGLTAWIFEIDDTTGTQVAERLLEIARDLPAARAMAAKARAFAQERMTAMIAAIP